MTSWFLHPLGESKSIWGARVFKKVEKIWCGGGGNGLNFEGIHSLNKSLGAQLCVFRYSCKWGGWGGVLTVSTFFINDLNNIQHIECKTWIYNTRVMGLFCCICGIGWRRPIGCLIFIGHFPQKNPTISGSFCEKWPATYGILWVFATL